MKPRTVDVRIARVVVDGSIGGAARLAADGASLSTSIAQRLAAGSSDAPSGDGGLATTVAEAIRRRLVAEGIVFDRGARDGL